MSVTTDIFRSWRNPAGVIRHLLGAGLREDRALAILMGGCLVIFIAQLPRLSRIAHLDGIELDRLVAYEFLAWMIVWPLGFYLIAAISHLVARVLGGQGSGYSARLALFWALLASSPAALLYGLIAGFIGPGAGLDVTGVLWLASFAIIWLLGLREVEFRTSQE